MPTVWVKFDRRQESERAMDRLEYAGFERESISRIEGADGRWSVGIYVDHPEAPRARAIMSDPNAPTSRDAQLTADFWGRDPGRNGLGVPAAEEDWTRQLQRLS